jgi:tyrosyl-tRNA synthetase
MVLTHFQRAGHRPIAVVGGGSGMIGDPTDRNSARPLLSVEQIEHNLAGIRRQFAPYLDFGEGRGRLVNNADWLLPLRYIEFLRDVGRHFTLNQLMQHGTYWERFQEQSFSYIELNYALIQAYDFLHLYRAEGCILQIGGNDQWFNILSGRDLIRRAEGGEAFALTMPLITNSSGEKFGKSTGNAVWLDPEQTSPYEYYQYWRNADDQNVGRFLRMYTFLPLGEILELEQRSGSDINAAKEVLAFEATRITHGDDEARRAQETSRAWFGGQGVASGPSLVVSVPTRLEELALAAGLVDSLSDAKRHIRQGALRLNGQPQERDRIVHPNQLPLLLSLGKRKVQLVAS